MVKESNLMMNCLGGDLLFMHYLHISKLMTDLSKDVNITIRIRLRQSDLTAIAY